MDCLRVLQDTAKSMYQLRQHASAIDLNRAGTGLMEIVSEPDMRSVLEVMLPCFFMGSSTTWTCHCDGPLTINGDFSGLMGLEN